MPTILRGIMSLLFLTAPVLASFELWQAPSANLGGISIPRWVSVCGIGYELIIAGMLVTGVWPRAVLRLCFATFGIFAILTAWLTFSGAATCGCFGRLAVPPWITSSIDTAMLMWVGWTMYHPPEHPEEIRSLDRFRTSRIRIAMAFIPGLCISAAIAIHRPDLGAQIEAAIRAGDHLDVEGAQRIDTGSWTVICYRSDCPHCAASMGDWLEWTSLDQKANNRRWAFLDVGEDRQQENLLDHFPHDAVVRWRRPMPYLSTPLVLSVVDGVVQRTYASIEDFSAALPSQ